MKQVQLLVPAVRCDVRKMQTPEFLAFLIEEFDSAIFSVVSFGVFARVTCGCMWRASRLMSSRSAGSACPSISKFIKPKPNSREMFTRGTHHDAPAISAEIYLKRGDLATR